MGNAEDDLPGQSYGLHVIHDIKYSESAVLRSKQNVILADSGKGKIKEPLECVQNKRITTTGCFRLQVQILQSEVKCMSQKESVRPMLQRSPIIWYLIWVLEYKLFGKPWSRDDLWDQGYHYHLGCIMSYIDRIEEI